MILDVLQRAVGFCSCGTCGEQNRAQEKIRRGSKVCLRRDPPVGYSQPRGGPDLASKVPTL